MVFYSTNMLIFKKISTKNGVSDNLSKTPFTKSKNTLNNLQLRISHHIYLGNNIDVDPTFKCHAERSRSIYLKRGLRSIDFSPCGRRPSVHIQLFAALIENHN